MSTDILLIRDGEGFRVLFGHLRLTAVLSMYNEALVDIKDEEGGAKVVRTPAGLLVTKNNQQLPLLRN